MKAARRLLEQLGVEVGGSEPVTSVDLSHKSLNAPQVGLLADLLRTSLTLVYLKLGYNDLRDEGAEIVAHALENHSSITSLDLGFNKIGDVGAQALGRCLSVNRGLRTLYLSGNSIQEAGFQSLSNALQQNSSLTALHLTGNNGGHAGAEFLSEALTINVSLSTLYVSGNGLGAQGAASLSQALTQNPTLTKLYMSDDSIGDQGCIMLAEALAHHKAMEVLELSFNGISAISIERMVNSLYCYTSLQTLFLDNNKVGDVGARLLARVLPTLMLEELNVAFDDIGNEGVVELMKAMVSNSTLRVLMLSGNTVNTDGARAVAYMLAHNTSLQTLYLDHMSIGQAGERYICAAVASSRQSALRNLTGFRLGTAMVQLGNPTYLEGFSNEQALQFIRESHEAYKTSLIGRNGEQRRNLRERDTQDVPPMAGTKRTQTSTFSDAPPPQERIHIETEQSEYEVVSTTDPGDHHVGNKRDPSASSVPNPPLVTPYTVQEQLDWSEQQRLKGFPPNILQQLRDLTALPFDPAELWELHQFYFSPPPPSPNVHNDVQRYKRHGNSRTVSRISCYPRLKYHLELLKADSDDSRMLTLLRQLQHLERSIDALCDPHSKHEMDLEGILLEVL